MARLFSFAILLILAWPAVPAAAPQKKATTRRSAATGKKAVTTKKQASAKSPAASKKPAATQKKQVTSSRSAAASRSRSSKKASTRAAGSWRQTQQAPTTERYREIQRALAEKGFLKTEPTGSWGPESAEALREFQRANNLPDSGKIDSLSLFALGLGPKRTAAAKPSEPETTPQQP